MITETPPRLEPCLPESLEPEIVDLIAALSTAAERLGNRLNPKTAASLADLVRKEYIQDNDEPVIGTQ